MDQKTTVLFTLNFPPRKGGIETLLVPILALSPDKMIVFTPRQPNDYDYDSTLAFLVIRTPNLGSTLINTILMFLYSIPVFLKNRVSHIQSGSIHAAFASYLASKIFKIKYSLYVHGMEISILKTNIKSQLYNSVFKFILKNSKLIIAFNSRARNDLIELGIDQSVVHTINPGINLNSYSTSDIEVQNVKSKYLINIENLNEKTIILTVGRLVKRKGHDQVLKAIAKISNPNIIYLIIGQGPESENLKNLTDELRLTKNAIFITNIEDYEKNAFYKLSDIFVMANRELKDSADIEGFGIVFIEANFHGLAVIGGENGGVSDAIEHNKSGLLVDSENVDEIAKAIDLLTADKDFRLKLGEYGKSRAIRFFDSRDVAAKITKQIREIQK